MITRQTLIAMGRNHLSRPYTVNYPKPGDLHDCRWWVNLVLAKCSLPTIDFPEDWTSMPRPLPLTEISLKDARPGDLVTFYIEDWGRHYPESMTTYPFHIAILSAGNPFDIHAKCLSLPWCQASAEQWMGPQFSKGLCNAYKIEGLSE